MTKRVREVVLEAFESISFIVPGDPIPMPRARATAIGGKPRLYTPAYADSHKRLVALCWRKAINGKPPRDIYTNNPVSLCIVVYRTLPKSAPAWQRRMVEHGLRAPVNVKPDWDNYGKLVSDALNGLAYKDDGQVFEGLVSKRYGTTAETRISVTYYRWVEKE